MQTFKTLRKFVNECIKSHYRRKNRLSHEKNQSRCNSKAFGANHAWFCGKNEADFLSNQLNVSSNCRSENQALKIDTKDLDLPLITISSQITKLTAVKF